MQKKKLLIVDDEVLFTQAMASLFTHEGFEVTVANNGKEAIASLSRQLPDVIITDILMPESDGIELLFHLKSNSNKVPVIAISGGGRINAINYLKMAERFGAAVSLNKPLSFDELLLAVQSVLAKKE